MPAETSRRSRATAFPLTHVWTPPAAAVAPGQGDGSEFERRGGRRILNYGHVACWILQRRLVLHIAVITYAHRWSGGVLQFNAGDLRRKPLGDRRLPKGLEMSTSLTGEDGLQLSPLFLSGRVVQVQARDAVATEEVGREINPDDDLAPKAHSVRVALLDVEDQTPRTPSLVWFGGADPARAPHLAAAVLPPPSADSPSHSSSWRMRACLSTAWPLARAAPEGRRGFWGDVSAGRVTEAG